LSPRSEYTGGM